MRHDLEERWNRLGETMKDVLFPGARAENGE
jgi:hypothetical protein